MAYRVTPFENEGYYHLYNRGVEKRIIFNDERDYDRFLQTIYYYQFDNLKFRFSLRGSPLNEDYRHNQKIVEIICYCLMPNHFHLLVRQLKDDGTQKFMQRILNSYTKYFNTKNKRVGPLLQGAFKAVPVETDEQLVHVTRYIHLNPFTSGLTKDVNTYPFSSYHEFTEFESNPLCNSQQILRLFKNKQDYQEFVEGHADYSRELGIMKHLLLEED